MGGGRKIFLYRWNSGPDVQSIQNKSRDKVHALAGHEGPEGGVEVHLYTFFNFGARWGRWSTPQPPDKETRYLLYSSLDGPQTQSAKIRSPNRPLHSDSLHRLRHPDPPVIIKRLYLQKSIQTDFWINKNTLLLGTHHFMLCSAELLMTDSFCHRS
jgi:hypothetical protein